MEKSQLRQRLVGALVLVALLAIIVPFFLGDQPDMPPEHIASIPPAPEQIPGADIPIDEGVADMPPVDEVTPNTVIDAVTPPTTTPAPAPEKDTAAGTPVPPRVPAPEKQPALKPAPVPATWVVQLGSFSSEQNAWALRDKLRNKGYHAFVERVSEGGKMAIRVRIGPELQRAKPEAVQQKLEKEMKIKGIVMSK